MIKTIDLHFGGMTNTIACFLYETPDGPILFETGPYSTYETLCEGIRSYGYEPQDIKHVFLTHIHLDHCGAAWAFADMGAKIYVHPAGRAHLIDPERLWKSAEMIYGDEMNSLWGEMRPIDKVKVVSKKDSEMTRIGNIIIRSWHTPGHAKHHISWLVNRELIAGEAAGTKIEGGPVFPACPPPEVNLEDWAFSIRRIRALDLNKMHLTHGGAVVNITQHLDEFEKNLAAWANWVKPFVEKQTPQDKVVPLFEEYVSATLLASGISEEVREKYEKTNPAWISLMGLNRYWKKNLKIFTATR